MKKNKIIKVALIVVLVGIVGAGGFAFYMFNKPHRDVQALAADFNLTSSSLVQEYLSDASAANQKYLDDTGDSKIIAVTGKIKSISRDMNQQLVILLQYEVDKAGVSCTFATPTSPLAEKFTVGQTVTVKGVIRSGAGFDPDLDLYEDVILEKCDIQ